MRTFASLSDPSNTAMPAHSVEGQHPSLSEVLLPGGGYYQYPKAPIQIEARKLTHTSRGCFKTQLRKSKWVAVLFS